jgi:excisionase family DNA binding protein
MGENQVIQLINLKESDLQKLMEKVLLNVFGDKLDKILSCVHSIEEDETYTPEDIAGMLQKNTQTIRRHIREGKLQSSKVGRHYCVTKAQLKDYLASDIESYDLN